MKSDVAHCIGMGLGLTEPNLLADPDGIDARLNKVVVSLAQTQILNKIYILKYTIFMCLLHVLGHFKQFKLFLIFFKKKVRKPKLGSRPPPP